MEITQDICETSWGDHKKTPSAPEGMGRGQSHALWRGMGQLVVKIFDIVNTCQ